MGGQLHAGGTAALRTALVGQLIAPRGAMVGGMMLSFARSFRISRCQFNFQFNFRNRAKKIYESPIDRLGRDGTGSEMLNVPQSSKEKYYRTMRTWSCR